MCRITGSVTPKPLTAALVPQGITPLHTVYQNATKLSTVKRSFLQFRGKMALYHATETRALSSRGARKALRHKGLRVNATEKRKKTFFVTSHKIVERVGKCRKMSENIYPVADCNWRALPGSSPGHGRGKAVYSRGVNSHNRTRWTCSNRCLTGQAPVFHACLLPQTSAAISETETPLDCPAAP